MEASVFAVEKILNYNFQKQTASTGSVNALLLHRLSFLSAAGVLRGRRSGSCVDTEKLARVAIKHGLYRFVRHNAIVLDDKVKEFSDAVGREDDDDDGLVYGGSIKAPKILADIVESVAAAVYVDVDFDLQKLWVIFRGILEPIVTFEDLRQQPQPVTTLFEMCQKQGKIVDIKHWKNESRNIASVHVDGQFIASSSSEQKEIAKLNAAKGALLKLSNSFPTNLNNVSLDIFDGSSSEIEGAKQKLHELCIRKKWPKPNYNIENEMGPPHEKKFVCAVQISTADGILYVRGDERMRVKDGENSAASSMIRALQDTDYL
ncbi:RIBONUCLEASE 3-LIKE PROTEIN 2-RELATED [Salix koriyanagi]|uniref:RIBONUCLEASE 3-LIKE PROTEIN 2-RELATED n=1 Tax=Salix koriyanagi TaxID=2511006 RepID=A0A9Q0ZBJ9_9ROSI|nr:RIBONUCLEASE 3-LIKE PROTEIN 2-RELATED [Salix koriyanagi]